MNDDRAFRRVAVRHEVLPDARRRAPGATSSPCSPARPSSCARSPSTSTSWRASRVARRRRRRRRAALAALPPVARPPGGAPVARPAAAVVAEVERVLAVAARRARAPPSSPADGACAGRAGRLRRRRPSDVAFARRGRDAQLGRDRRRRGRAAATRIAELGKEITADYAGRPPLLVGVLKGAFVFMSDLSRAIDLPVEFDFMAVSSYGSATRSSGVVRIIKDLDLDLTDRHVLIVEDIVDSGLTLAYLRKNLAAREPGVARGVRAAA